MDVLSGINRPDYSVIYYVPVYRTIKLFQRNYNTRVFVGYNNLIDIPYTGNYYIQDSSIQDFTCDFVCFKYIGETTSSISNGDTFLAKGKTIPQNEQVELLYYLNRTPDQCTLLGDISQSFYITYEDGGHILLESPEDGAILQEAQLKTFKIISTRTVKARFGNLNGIQDGMFPVDKQPYGYGLYGQNVFLTGEFYLNNGQAVADIGEEAIAFAIASAKENANAINLLRNSMEQADELIRKSHYNKGTLKTAGMRIGYDSLNNPGIVLWGNQIIIATTEKESTQVIKCLHYFINFDCKVNSCFKNYQGD